MSTSSKQNVSLMFRNVNSHQGMHISRQYGSYGVCLDLTNLRSANFRHPLVVVSQENITRLTKRSTLSIEILISS